MQPVSNAQRRLIAESLEHPRYRELRRHKLCDAVVMQSVLVRGAFGAMPANAKIESAIDTFGTAADAIPFLTAHFATVGLAFDESMREAIRRVDEAFEGS